MHRFYSFLYQFRTAVLAYKGLLPELLDSSRESPPLLVRKQSPNDRTLTTFRVSWGEQEEVAGSCVQYLGYVHLNLLSWQNLIVNQTAGTWTSGIGRMQLLKLAKKNAHINQHIQNTEMNDYRCMTHQINSESNWTGLL